MLQAEKNCTTLVALLRFRASHTPRRLAYTYLKEGVHEDQTYTYAELDQAARAVAVALARALVQPGERVLLVYPPGLEFIAAFFGCLYAGVVPIPAPPPEGARFKRTFPRLRAIIEDAGARLILATDAICQNSLSLEQETTPWLCSDKIDIGLADAWSPPPIAASDLAYLQYTSGSTSSPKGVMLTHACVLRNLSLSQTAWDYSGDSVAVTWMPYFHDYGLVDGLLQPVYTGIPCYVLSPLTFIKRPLRWLEAIHRYRGTHTQAPNFAYELCLNKITPAQRDALDLSCWRTASNGAEPVREATFTRFVEYFAPCGFRPEAFYPSYGLAEATLLVATKPVGEVAKSCSADADALERDQRYVAAQPGALARSVVSCGTPLGDMRLGDMQLAIVDPQTRRRCAAHEVGEVWVSDPSVAVGYWGQEAESAAVFNVRPEGEAEPDSPSGYMRTGDLGFLSDGELYVTGRLKDLIIIAGVNHYPQDIEWSVQQSHPEFRPDHCAAFSVEQGGEEHLVVVAEVNRPLDDWQPLFEAVRRAVSDGHELELYAFVALRKGGILKTSSGKLQRRNCRSAFLDGTLAALAQWTKPHAATAPAAATPGAAGMEADRLAGWLIAALAARLELSPHEIDPQAPFATYGLTSRIGVELVGDLEQWLGKDDLSPTLLWEYPSVAALSAHLAGTGVGATHGATHLARAPTDGALAIIGMACRLPGADSPEEFWRLLGDKRVAIQSLPAGRWQGAGIPVKEGVGPGCVTTLRGGFLSESEVAGFDADFFGIGGREAEIMDPQQRLLLEVAWEAIERAGLDIGELAGSATGVYVGISTDDYSAWQFGVAENISAYTGPAKALCIAANRISYQFDFLGPSMAIDTACSSSLVAIHLASQALRRGECSLALAGGVNLILAPQMSIALSQAGMLAPDGCCKTFDAAADGYARGEGCTLLVLKRLDDALRDGDTITAVIRGSAINQDGRSNGLTAPNGLAQQRVVGMALAAAGVAPAEIGYVEAHGTGTALGDPIEVKALQAVLAAGREPAQRCALGAVKANIGHLEAAAGVAGVLKAALSLAHGEIPPHPSLRQLNPLIALEGSSFYVPTERTPWTEGRRLAGVSSFGFGGTNAHVVLEAPPAPAPRPTAHEPERPLHLLTLCAHGTDALRAMATRWHTHLEQSGIEPADLCFSANTGRARLPERLALFAADRPSLAAALDDWLAGRPGAWAAGTAKQTAPRIGFLFTGQGSQYVGMGRELYQTQPGFRRDMDECDALLQQETGQSLIALLYRAEPGEAGEALLARTDLTQPVLFALEYALARLWMSWGIQPAALLGHSIGEYAAACIAGVFSLATGLRLVAARARLMHEAPGDGGMVAVVADEAQCRAALIGAEDKVVIAVYNGPRNHVLSGERAALNQVVARLAAQGVETRPLKVSHAFHSPLMEPVLESFARVAGELAFNPPAIPVYSNISGAPLGAEQAGAAYWVDHLRSPVRYAEGVRAMRAAGLDAFIEIGPRPTLLALAQQSLDEAELQWLPSLRPQASDSRLMLESLAALHVRGTPVDWRGFDRHWPRRRAPIPTYAFQHRRYWLPALADSGDNTAVSAARPFPGQRIASPLLAQTLFENRYDTATLPLLAEHRVFGQVVVPGAAHLSLVVEAAASFLGSAPCALQDVIFPQALVVPEPGARRIQLAIASPDAEGGRLFKLISLPAEDDESWEEHATGRLLPLAAPAEAVVDTLAVLRNRCPQIIAADFYREIWQSAITLGPRFRWVTEVRRGENQVLARLEMPEQAALDAYRLHPGLIDSMLQVLTAAVDKQADEALVPFGFEEFRWYAPLQGTTLWSHIQLRPAQGASDEVLSDVSLYAADGRLIAEARGWSARRMASRNLVREKAGALDDALYAMRWDETTLAATPMTGVWLVVGEQPEAVERLAQAMEAQPGSKQVHCLRALVDSPSGNFVYLNLDAAGQAHETLGALGTINGVAYIAATAEAEATLTSAIRACTRVLHLVQAMVGIIAPTPRLVLLTRAAQPLPAGATPRADQAALWGLARVARLEHPELACHCIDLDDDDANAARLAALLNHPDETEIALRNGRIWIPRLERRRQIPRSAPELRADATYLVSGGLGALGLRLAEWLAARGARHLLLLGRRPPSEAAAGRIAALEQQGVQVHNATLNIADADALSALLSTAVPPIAGVFHLAGVLDDGMLLQQNHARYATVLTPKLGGALNLSRAFAAQPLDYFVCFSSAAALTGSLGQSAYAAANAALDALMEARRMSGKPGLSIQWGPWAESGMAAHQAERDRQRFAGYGIDAIAPSDGMALLGRLLATDGGALAVLDVDWPTYLGQLYRDKFPPIYRELSAAASKAVAPAASGLAENLLAAAPEQRRTLLEQHLRTAVEGVLGLAGRQQIAPRQRLFELGLDSLGAVELRNRLVAALGRNLRATLLFDYPTLAALADHIEHDVLGFPPDSAPEEAAPAPAENLEQLSDDELASLLAAELGA